jgi:hypothetical protein
MSKKSNDIDHKAILDQAIKEREERYPVVNDQNVQSAFTFQDDRRIALTEIAVAALKTNKN